MDTTQQNKQKTTDKFKYELSDEFYDGQCGEVFITRHRKLVLHCLHCSTRYDGLSSFLDHLLTEHYVNEENDLEEPSRDLVDETRCNSSFEGENTGLLEDFYEIPDEDSNIEIIPDFQGDSTEKAMNEIEVGRKYVEEHQSLDLERKDFEDFNSSSEETSFPELPRCKIERKKMFKCNKCDKLFINLSKWRSHAVTHSDQRKFKCTICSKIFNQEYNLRAHMQRHTGDKRFSCELCDKRFFTNQEAGRHQLTHSDERPYICSSCGKTFLRMTLLREHMKRHENLRPFKCDVCEKCFYSRAHLNKHMPTHTNERPFACNICPAKFSQGQTLRTHKKLHINAREYSCSLCEKSFNQRPALTSHLKINHKVVDSKTKESNFL